LFTLAGRETVSVARESGLVTGLIKDENLWLKLEGMRGRHHGGEAPFIGARNVTFHCVGRALVLTFIMKVDQIEAFLDLNPAF
jgi:hypothetical protein